MNIQQISLTITSMQYMQRLFCRQEFVKYLNLVLIKSSNEDAATRATISTSKSFGIESSMFFFSKYVLIIPIICTPVSGILGLLYEMMMIKFFDLYYCVHVCVFEFRETKFGLNFYITKFEFPIPIRSQGCLLEVQVVRFKRTPFLFRVRFVIFRL